MNPSLQARALNAIFRDLMATHDGATYFAGRVWGIHTHYDLEGNHPLTGYSVPNFELADGKIIGELLRDGSGILLDFHGNDALKTLAGEYSNQIKYISVSVTEQLGLNALLIRPDGFIAWATDDEPGLAELQKAADLWFVRDIGYNLSNVTR